MQKTQIRSRRKDIIFRGSWYKITSFNNLIVIACTKHYHERNEVETNELRLFKISRNMYVVVSTHLAHENVHPHY